jgi:hypothetical protein
MAEPTGDPCCKASCESHYACAAVCRHVPLYVSALTAWLSPPPPTNAPTPSKYLPFPSSQADITTVLQLSIPRGNIYRRFFFSFLLCASRPIRDPFCRRRLELLYHVSQRQVDHLGGDATEALC